jgi:chromosome segregation ATPase
MESLRSDFGAQITEVETATTNLEASTRQQIDIGAEATERTNEHVNHEIIEMNTKLDSVDLRLTTMEAQLADLSPTVTQYRTEGILAMLNLAVMTGGIRVKEEMVPSPRWIWP